MADDTAIVAHKSPNNISSSDDAIGIAATNVPSPVRPRENPYADASGNLGIHET